MLRNKFYDLFNHIKSVCKVKIVFTYSHINFNGFNGSLQISIASTMGTINGLQYGFQFSYQIQICMLVSVAN